MAQAVGVEAGVTVVLPWKGIVASASYTRQSITDQSDRPGIDGTAIPYSPPELFSAALAWQNEFFSTAAQWSYTSFRYAQPGAEFTSLLRPFSLANVSVGAHGAIGALQAHVRLQCDNLFDERYAVVRGFPMPGRMIRIRLDSSWNPTNQ
jgi:outer membrane cobalamin receptor